MSKILNAIKEIAAGMSASESYARCSVAALRPVRCRPPVCAARALRHVRRPTSGRASSGMEQQFGDVGGTMLKQPLESDVGIDLEAIANARRQHDDEVLFEGALEKLITTHVDGEATQSWDQRYGRLTRTRLLLSFSQTETVREDISLEDIDILSSDVAEREESITLNSGLTLGDDGKAPGDRKEENDTSKVLHGLVWSNCFRIFAAKYRRNYYLRAKSEEERDAWLEAIRDQKQILHEESIRAAQKTLAQKIRPKVKAIVSSVQFQSSVAVLLFCNFLLNIYEVETKADESTKEAYILKILDYSFTVVYVIELLCNLFAHWWRDFLYNGWSVFDAVCVLSSLIGMLLTAFVGEGMDLSIVRSLRIFKIVRIFSRLKSLQVLRSATAYIVCYFTHVHAPTSPPLTTCCTVAYSDGNHVHTVSAFQHLPHLPGRCCDLCGDGFATLRRQPSGEIRDLYPRCALAVPGKASEYQSF